MVLVVLVFRGGVGLEMGGYVWGAGGRGGVKRGEEGVFIGWRCRGMFRDG